MLDLQFLARPESWISLLTLSAMEVVLGIDNIVFMSILTGKLPDAQQPLARRLGLSLALLIRIGLLFAISWVMRLTAPLFQVMDNSFSGRDLILLGGGLFLIGKSAHEIFDKLEVEAPQRETTGGQSAFAMILVQILILDIVFSLDSVITAVGMAQHLAIMVTAMIVAVVVMLIFAKSIGDFVNRHPSMKILALSFLILIGVMLVAEGFGQQINKGYIYFAIAFALVVELINFRVRQRVRAPIKLGNLP